MYLAGHIFLFELAPGGAVPASGTVWTMRSYIGHVNGGNGAAGAEGPYSFTRPTRPFSAVGATLQLGFSATKVVAADDQNDLPGSIRFPTRTTSPARSSRPRTPRSSSS